MLKICSGCGFAYSNSEEACPQCGRLNEEKEKGSTQQQVHIIKDGAENQLIGSTIVAVLGFVIPTIAFGMKSANFLILMFVLWVYYLTKKNNYVYGFIGAVASCVLGIFGIGILFELMHLGTSLQNFLVVLIGLYPIYKLFVVPIRTIISK